MTGSQQSLKPQLQTTARSVLGVHLTRHTHTFRGVSRLLARHKTGEVGPTTIIDSLWHKNMITGASQADVRKAGGIWRQTRPHSKFFNLLRARPALVFFLCASRLVIRSTVSAVFQKISNITHTHLRINARQTSTNKRPTHNHQSYDQIQNKIFSPVLRASRLQSFFRPRICVGNHFGLRGTRNTFTSTNHAELKVETQKARSASQCTTPSIVVAGALCCHLNVFNLDCVHVVTSSFAFSFLPYLLLFYVVCGTLVLRAAEDSCNAVFGRWDRTADFGWSDEPGHPWNCAVFPRRMPGARSV